MNSLWNITAGKLINGEGILVKAHKKLKIL